MNYIAIRGTNIKIILMLVWLIITQTAAHDNCIHDHMQHRSVSSVAQNRLSSNDPSFNRINTVLKRAATVSNTIWSQALTIHVDYTGLVGDDHACYDDGDTVDYGDGQSSDAHTCVEDDILTTEKETRLKELLDEAIDLFQSTLSVLPISGVNVSVSAVTSSCNLDIYSSDYDEEISSHNFVLFVTARPISVEGVVAYATYCQTDSYGRPIVGHMNIAPATMKTDDLSKVSQAGVVKHEIVHSLGFSTSKLTNEGFIKWNEDGSWEPRPVSEIVQDNAIITTLTVDRVKNYFGCDTMEGVELEDDGITGSVGSHWEKRLFMNEFMTATQSSVPIVSLITFSLLEDSGWYFIYNTTKLEPLVWGRGQGCDFTDSCSTWPSTRELTGYKCNAATPEYQCTFDLRAYGTCNFGEGTYTDDCSFIEPNESVQNCVDPEVPESFLSDTLDTGESRGLDSRCFVSSLWKTSDHLDFAKFSQFEEFRCYDTRCKSNTELMVRIDGGIYYPCEISGNTLDEIVGFSGSIKCVSGAAYLTCLGASTDPLWPEITSVDPTSAEPGRTVVIRGTNLGDVVKVHIKDECPEIQIISDFEILVTLPDSDSWGSFSDLFTSKESVVVYDSEGRTHHLYEHIDIDLNFFTTLGNFFNFYPAIAGGITAGILGCCLIVILCSYCCCCAGSRHEQSAKWSSNKKTKLRATTSTTTEDESSSTTTTTSSSE
eukprot:TRINITY_DN762_c0_g1_i1.p1 TRINITY_DN762_c0_g1~~TRINITY_DN762_c0_g1_i1.p1  ORF type:complete len:713 (-),score=146.24 TRINITY_DN762_c0_g1_i1:1134-3272(-)